MGRGTRGRANWPSVTSLPEIRCELSTDLSGIVAKEPRWATSPRGAEMTPRKAPWCSLSLRLSNSTCPGKMVRSRERHSGTEGTQQQRRRRAR